MSEQIAERDAIAGLRHCAYCTHGRHFTARNDEIERYGSEVMGCKRPNWEGYTQQKSTCEAFTSLLPQLLVTSKGRT